MTSTQTFRQDGPGDDVQVAMADRHLKQLAALREIGYGMVEELRDIQTQGKDALAIRKVAAFDKLTRAIRQLMALEQEIVGLREKRKNKLMFLWRQDKQDIVRRSVERSLIKGKPQLAPLARERLLADLFLGETDLKGTIRDIVIRICATLGVEADLSLWEEPQPEDITLPKGRDWVVPANGDKPYTLLTSAAGIRTRQPFDSPHLKKAGTDPPDG